MDDSVNSRQSPIDELRRQTARLENNGIDRSQPDAVINNSPGRKATRSFDIVRPAANRTLNNPTRSSDARNSRDNQQSNASKVSMPVSVAPSSAQEIKAVSEKPALLEAPILQRFDSAEHSDDRPPTDSSSEVEIKATATYAEKRADEVFSNVFQSDEYHPPLLPAHASRPGKSYVFAWVILSSLLIGLAILMAFLLLKK